MAARRDRLAETLLEREASLRAGRQPWESLWQSVSRYVLPHEATFTEESSPGVERSRYILDSTAPRALELFAAFLHTLLNNPAKQWFRLRIRNANRSLRDSPEVKKWLEEVERRMLAELSSESTNLYQHLHQTYLDLGAFGTAVLFVEFRDERLRVRAFHLADCVVEENEAGFVDAVHRQFMYTARQAHQRWGDAAGKTVVEALSKRGKNRRDEPVRFVHTVVPIDEKGMADMLPARVRNSGSPFASVWVNAEDRVVVSAGTYEEFPYMVPRWVKARGELYGRSPAIKVLPDIRMANRMRETILRGAEKIVDPPMVLPDGGMLSPVRLYPGGIGWSEGNNWDPKFLVAPGASRIEVGSQLLADTQRAIDRGFFVQLFQTEDTPVKTATQVLQETGERNRALSPMLIRTQAELFHPLLLRTYHVMRRNGRLPAPPEVLVQTEAQMDVEYVSPLEGSQREMEALATLRTFESLAPWAQIDTGIFDAFEPDEVAKVVHAGTGMPAETLRTPAQVRRIREARAEQERAEEGFQRGKDTAESAAKLIAASSKGRK